MRRPPVISTGSQSYVRLLPATPCRNTTAGASRGPSSRTCNGADVAMAVRLRGTVVVAVVPVRVVQVAADAVVDVVAVLDGLVAAVRAVLVLRLVVVALVVRRALRRVGLADRDL